MIKELSQETINEGVIQARKNPNLEVFFKDNERKAPMYAIMRVYR